ncbi:104 kDa microneme-rhoptry antigen precursor p104, putative [Theileria equi strain WA]|uniref:104 kDa microneme-rhoptry antigen p104, putative n=1 Tax=Theileria equi strain WA TaxID=1537102 RepID=L0B0U2_THEEQ|nr:104 kDa microneme-rhoptry antigen precursor p104, putative [Theileria equi strain WA]AFZ81467.1 104 kDa microneme-rhoptry antigen precursor p104, putative [Theileria equi strain WA]|eukprot:XP_004831133.1 104 kDa microneme-rhoptry antigen precursor p104, putative [Theileria equi strain WA]
MMIFLHFTLWFAFLGLAVAIEPKEDKTERLTLDITDQNRFQLCLVKTKEYNDLESIFYIPRKGNLNKLIEGGVTIFESDSAKLSEVMIVMENNEARLALIQCAFETSHKYYEKVADQWHPIDHGTFEDKRANIRSRMTTLSRFQLNLESKRDCSQFVVKRLDCGDHILYTYTPKCGHHATSVIFGKTQIWTSNDGKRCAEVLAYCKDGVLRAAQLFIADLKTEEILYFEIKGELSVPISDSRLSLIVMEMQSETKRIQYILDIANVDRTNFEVATCTLGGVTYTVYEPKSKYLEAIVDGNKRIWQIQNSRERCYSILTHGRDEQILVSLNILDENLGTVDSRYYHKDGDVWKPTDASVFYTELEDLKDPNSSYSLGIRSSYLTITPKMCIIALLMVVF